jgi:hypothetical protein
MPDSIGLAVRAQNQRAYLDKGRIQRQAMQHGHLDQASDPEQRRGQDMLQTTIPERGTKDGNDNASISTGTTALPVVFRP